MSHPSLERWAERLRATSAAFPYPPTPGIAGAVRRRLEAEAPRAATPRGRLAWALAVALVAVMSGLLAVPRVRAGIVEYFQIGLVRILVRSTPTPPQPAPTGTQAPTATPRPSPTPLPSVLNLSGETTLAEAKARARFPIRLPAYPADLGLPDRVFLQDLGGSVVVLVWLDPAQPERVRMSLHALGPGSYAAGKSEPMIVERTTVHGETAAWTEGPYLLEFTRAGRAEVDLGRLITGHVLIWTEQGITYRLETDLLLPEAVRIAESLAVIE